MSHFFVQIIFWVNNSERLSDEVLVVRLFYATLQCQKLWKRGYTFWCCTSLNKQIYASIIKTHKTINSEQNPLKLVNSQAGFS